jgi:hypothetical protein
MRGRGCSGFSFLGFPGLLASSSSAGARAFIIGSNKRGFGGWCWRGNTFGGWSWEGGGGTRDGREAGGRLHLQRWRTGQCFDGEDASVSGFHPQSWRTGRGFNGEDDNVSRFHPQRWGSLGGRSDVAEQGSEVLERLDFAVSPWGQWKIGGDGCVKAWTISWIPARTRSVEEARGIVTLEGNHERVSVMRVRRVSHIQTMKQR